MRLPFVEPDVPQAPRSDLIFRLRAWPRLPEDGRTAEVYRMLSVMSNQPVNRHWLLTRFALAHLIGSLVLTALGIATLRALVT